MANSDFLSIKHQKQKTLINVKLILFKKQVDEHKSGVKRINNNSRQLALLINIGKLYLAKEDIYNSDQVLKTFSNDELKQSGQFWLWVYIGVGTVRHRVMSYFFGKNWESLKIIDSMTILKEKFNLDISNMDLPNGSYAIKDLYEKLTGENIAELRKANFHEEWNSLK